MVDARAVANYILDCACQRGIPITAMTLLKVLYFSHAWHLVKYERPLVAQPFEAWKHGPVNRVVYEQIKHCNRRPIVKRFTSFDAKSCSFIETGYSFDHELSTFLLNIFDYYTKFDPFELSDLTHERGSPWEIVWQRAEKKAVPGMIIPDTLILQWFRGAGGTNASKAQ
jgi:uncharacterized phage-associated protein